MKLILVLSCLLVVAYGLPEELVQMIKEKIAKEAAECKQTITVSQSDVELLKSHQLPESHEGKCFVGCMYKKMGFMDANGKIDVSGVYDMVSKIKDIDEDLHSKMKLVADSCVEKVKDSPDYCDTAADIFKCICAEKQALGLPMLQM